MEGGQLVELKDQDNNDIAALLADIKVMEKTDTTEYVNMLGED